MCEILIKAIDATHSDPIKDKRGCYKIGMPVVVMDDNHVWGNAEKWPTFFVLKIPMVTKDKVLKYIDTHIEPRIGIRTWNKLDYDKAIISGIYEGFVSIPIVLSLKTLSTTFIISNEQWVAVQVKGDYYPFQNKPTATLLSGEVSLTGDVIQVDLQGDILTPITRRLWQLQVSTLPLAAINKIKTGSLTIKATTLYNGLYDYTWTQVKSYFKNLQTSLNEVSGL